jgi:hypothetical protein
VLNATVCQHTPYQQKAKYWEDGFLVLSEQLDHEPNRSEVRSDKVLVICLFFFDINNADERRESLFGGTETDIGDIASNFSFFGASSGGEHNWKRIDQMVKFGSIIGEFIKQIVSDGLKGRFKQVQTTAEGLIRR